MDDAGDGAGACGATNSAAPVTAGAGGYSPVAQALHWLVVGLAIMVVSLGLAAGSAPHNSATRADLLLVHRSVGLTILLLMVLRVLWRWRHPPPPLPPSLARVEAALAHLTHLGLYLIFILMPLAGYLASAAAGHTGTFFGVFEIPRLVPVNERLSQWAIALHLVGQYVVYLLVALHVAGALYHAVIRRDEVLGRMLWHHRSARFGS
ncbi:MAG: cytochrome b [Alphaproteobacteria bacterium]|nr:cytochrome b [Alphaproteobacteria bacterium]